MRIQGDATVKLHRRANAERRAAIPVIVALVTG